MPADSKYYSAWVCVCTDSNLLLGTDRHPLKKELLVVNASLASRLPLGFSAPTYVSSLACAKPRAHGWGCARMDGMCISGVGEQRAGILDGLSRVSWQCFTKSVLQRSSTVTAWERNKVETVVKVASLSSLVFCYWSAWLLPSCGETLGRSAWHGFPCFSLPAVGWLALEFETEIPIRRKLGFISCRFVTRIATAFVGREEGRHSGITTDIKKILTWAHFPLSNEGREYTAQITLGCGAGCCATLKLAWLEGVPSTGRRFPWDLFKCKSEKRK